MQLRPYQEQCVNATLAGFQAYRKQVVVLPTGGGKTIVFAALVKRVQPVRSLILAHREELVFQAVDKIAKSTGIFAQVEKAEQSASLMAPVVVASVQTLQRRKEKYPRNHFGYVIADEAHHSVSDSWRSVLDYFDARILGVTATPDRGDKKNLGTFFENIAFELSLLDLIKSGYLVPIKVKALPLEIPLTNVRRTAGDFNDADLGDALAPYLRDIVAKIKEHASGRKILVFVPLIATSKTFVAHCQEAGISAAHVDGMSPDRKEILTDYAAGKYQLLSNAMLLTEGYDEPSVDCVVVLRPTGSRSLYSQIVGRGTRLSPGKTDLLLLDFIWLHEKHTLIRPAHLIAKCSDTADEMTRITLDQARAGGGGEMDLEDLAGAATEARENRLRELLEKQRKKKAKFGDALEFCLSLHSTDVADYEPTMPWHGEPVTDKQRGVLENLGVDPDSCKDKGHASALIDIAMQRRNAGLATYKQVRFLEKYEAEVVRAYGRKPSEITFDEASAFIGAKMAFYKR